MHRDWIFAVPTVYVVAALPLAAWFYLLAGRGAFWRVSTQTLAAQRRKPRAARVGVVIPARDEAANIAEAIRSLLGQPTVSLRIVVVDDHSDDLTADAALAAAHQLNRDADVTVIRSAPLAAGWTGKLWAVKQGVDHARKQDLDFLLLTDADIAHEPGSLAQLVALAEEGGYDLASLMVRLECSTFAEKLLIPAFVFFFFMLYPPRWIADSRARTAGAAGGCMLVRPSALDAIGGIEAIRSEVIDDCALATAIKRSGGRVWLGLAGESASIRPYSTFAAIGNMIARSAFNQLRHSAAILIGAIAGLSLCFVVPIALLFTGEPFCIVAGAAAWLAMSASYLPMVRYYRLSPLWSLTLPLSAVFYMGATIVSAVRYWTGRGGQWKGRAQDVAAR